VRAAFTVEVFFFVFGVVVVFSFWRETRLLFAEREESCHRFERGCYFVNFVVPE
jgi:hypothetical protein